MKLLRYTILFSLAVFFKTQTASAQCGAGEVQVIVQINPDSYPGETSWDLKDAGNGNVIAQGTTNSDTVCYPVGYCMVFTIHDSYGDGICCAYGNGSYNVWSDGVLVATGGAFTTSEATYFNCPPGTSCNSAFTAVTATPYTTTFTDSWYEFTPASNGMYEITTCGNNNCDTKIWVYDHCTNLVFNNTNIGTAYYDDNACGWQAKVSAALAAGSTYYIRIGDNGASCTNGIINWIINYGGPIVGCMDPLACNYNPLATVNDVAQCIYPGDPNCPNGPDLVVVASDFQNSLYLDSLVASNCAVTEGCLTGYGMRRIIRFTTHIQNQGNQDYFIGNPTNNPTQFVFGACHGHYHYQGYAEYDLYDTASNMIPIGFKNGFCVLDLECNNGGTAQYGCGNMGISVGCGDIYSAGLDCQWVDITVVDTGDYTLAIKVNWDQSPDALGHYETDYANNWAQKCIHIYKMPDGTNNFSILANCNPYIACDGVPYGNALPDCNGLCNGIAKRGDLNYDTLQTNTDALMYVNYILGDSLNAAPCNDLNADYDIDVYDAALLTGCANYGEAYPMPGGGTHNYCDFPTGLLNINDTTYISITGGDNVNHFVDIGVRNPDSRVLAYQFSISGLTIQSVQSLANQVQYPMTPSFSVANNLIVGLSYIDSSIHKSTPVQPLCRIYYSAATDTICIDSLYTIVNQNFEEVVRFKENGCLTGLISSGTPMISQAVSSLSISPNPSYGIFDAHIQLSNTQDAVIDVTDATGRILISQSLKNIFGKNVPLSLKNYSGGVYFVNVRTANEVMTERVVVIGE